MSSEPTPDPTDATRERLPYSEPMPVAHEPPSAAGWWFQVARVRLRFVAIVVIAGAVVSQWSLIRNVWDRWAWSSIHKHPASGSVSPSHEYFCPMDPGVISVWPAICPICNMDLVPRKKMEAVMLPEGVITRMQLSPYRIQLAGIRTAVIEPRSLKFEQTYSGVIRPLEHDKSGFECNVTAADAALFRKASEVAVHARSVPEPNRATASLIGSPDSPRARFELDESNSLPEGTLVTATVSFAWDDEQDVLAVPESAVIDRGQERLVYVESMPGMFDGVAVELGRRCGAYYPVTKGLKAGQRVASAGAFLIDAETRLNPSVATGYFGANQSGSSATPAVAPPVPAASKPATPKSTLSREDQELADKQRICPVTELPLTSMGGPVPVQVAGRKVFICCKGCEKRLKDEPEKYLAKFSSP